MSKDVVDIIVKVKYVFTMNSRREIIVDGAIAINGNGIVAVGKASNISPVWLRYLIPYESNLKPSDVRLTATLTQLNMIEHGITTFLEAGSPYPHEVAKAVLETGVRGTLPYQLSIW